MGRLNKDGDARVTGGSVEVPELNPRRYHPLLYRACPHCEARMWLLAIEPAKPGHDKLVLECTGCGHEEFIDVLIQDELSEAA